jgi:hypothetical protein
MNMYKVEAKPDENSHIVATYHVVVMANSDQEAEDEARKVHPGFKSFTSKGTIKYLSVSDYMLVPRAWG